MCNNNLADRDGYRAMFVLGEDNQHRQPKFISEGAVCMDWNFVRCIYIRSVIDTSRKFLVGVIFNGFRVASIQNTRCL